MAKHDSDILSVLPTPSSPTRWMTTPDVRKRLEENGIAIAHTKTVQRRLEALEQLGVVNCRDTGHALEWQRKDGASGIAAKAGALMTFEEALALQVLTRFSSNQLCDRRSRTPRWPPRQSNAPHARDAHTAFAVLQVRARSLHKACGPGLSIRSFVSRGYERCRNFACVFGHFMSRHAAHRTPHRRSMRLDASGHQMSRCHIMLMSGAGDPADN